MIKGMTGYGFAEMSLPKVKISVEVKSVNHRYFDVNYYLPIGWGALEDKIRGVVQKDIQRGRLTVAIKVVQKTSQNVSLNRSALRQHLKYAKTIVKEFRLKNDLALADVLKLPGVLEVKEELIGPDKLWAPVRQCLRKALDNLMLMRKREGRSLSKELARMLQDMLKRVKNIRQRTAAILKQKRGILTNEEFKSYQKSSDITEEIVRFNHYIKELKLLLKSTQPIGKNIDFVAQEMQRETNTMGSKLQDTFISSTVIALKSYIEKIREQAQNIE